MPTIRPLVPLVASLFLAATSWSCSGSRAVAYTGATVWDGTGAPPITNATIVVEAGRIVSVQQDPRPPRGAEVVPLDGRWVIPGLIDTHAHVSGRWAPGGGGDELSRIRDELRLYARYGVTTVNSLGDGDAVIRARDAASPTDPHARLLAAGAVVADSEPAAARVTAIQNADAGADWLKLRVDDNLGTSAKMPWGAVQAVMDVGRERGLRVATHVFYLDDAKRLLDMGAGLVAHSVRDVDVDEEFVQALRERSVCYVPTLVREVSTFVYSERPDFFDDPFFQRYADAEEVARLSSPELMEETRRSPAAAGYRVALAQAQRNVKALSDAGASIAFGTDAGPAARFPGYFEHMELSLLVEAGLTPAQALHSATGAAAACLGLDDVGTLESGRWADFLVLAADPLADVEASRTLERVYVAGSEVR